MDKNALGYGSLMVSRKAGLLLNKARLFGNKAGLFSNKGRLLKRNCHNGIWMIFDCHIVS